MGVCLEIDIGMGSAVELLLRLVEILHSDSSTMSK
jgi:hypothetical protein